MGKQNNNFEYFKPQQNGSSLLAPSESESEDSDSKAMFKLPKRKVIRSKGSGLTKGKRRLCCQVCCQSLIPVVISVFIIGTLVTIGCILLGVSGMKRELELLKIKIQIAQSESHSNLKDSRQLQLRLEKEFAASNKENKDEIKKLKSKILTLNKEMKILNTSLIQLKAKYETSKATSSSSVVDDVKLLKKGMADTGGEMKKLTDDSVEAKKTIKLLTKVVKGMKTQLVKMAHSLEDVSSKPFPTAPADTLAPLTASAASPEESKKSLGKISKLLKKVLNGYNEIFKNKTKHLDAELSRMNLAIQKRNSTYKQNIMAIREDINALQNVTEKHEERLDSISARLDKSKVSSSTSNATSNSKVLGIVKDILVGLKKHQRLISNLTSRVDKIDSRQKTTSENIVLAPAGTSNPSTTMQKEEINGLVPTSKSVISKAVATHEVRMSTASSTAVKNNTKQEIITTNNPVSNPSNVISTLLQVNGSSTDAPAVPREILQAPAKSESNATNYSESLISANPVVMVNSTEAPASEIGNQTHTIQEATLQSTRGDVPSMAPVTETSPVNTTPEPSSGQEASDEPTASQEASEEPTASQEASEEPTASQQAPEEPTASQEASEEPTASQEASEEPTASQRSGVTEFAKKATGTSEHVLKPSGLRNSRRRPHKNNDESFQAAVNQNDMPTESDESLENLDQAAEEESEDPSFT